MWLLLSTLFAGAQALRTLDPAPSSSASNKTAEERWLNVSLDHFSAFNNDMFPMRFYYNGEFASSNQSDNHIVIFVGGEWSIIPKWVTRGLAYELAGFIQAGLFHTEHRYYGRTRPTNDSEVSNLRYLTVDQALADLAQFIEYIKSEEFEDGMYSKGRVVLVGCSYAGSMATWMRLGYPHLIDAAFSDSGPLHAQVDFFEYFVKVNAVILEQGGSSCVNAIRDAIDEVDALLTTQAGAKTVSELFKTCSPQQTNQIDRATFWSSLTDSFAYLVQFALPGHVADACAALTNTSESSAMLRLANYVNSSQSSRTPPCIMNSYSECVSRYTNTSFDAEASETRLWMYQLCVEFGWFQTTDAEDHLFPRSVTMKYYQRMCQDLFSLNFNSNLTEAGVARTNLFFGGLTYLPDYVVSVSGGADPWTSTLPTEAHATPRAPVFVVPGVSHCRAIEWEKKEKWTEEKMGAQKY